MPLEREMGTPLFTRTTRRVAMTSAGAELLARAKVILDEVAADLPPGWRTQPDHLRHGCF